MEQKRTSLKEMAQILGVSVSTVSRALNGSPDIGAELTRRVNDLAKQLNYRPNPFAQSLKRKAPKVIGVVVPNLATHYYATVLSGIEDCARRHGYSVVTANSHEDSQREREAIDNFTNMYVDGIIVSLAQTTTDYSHFDIIDRMNIPLVFFARTCMTDRFSSVVSNGDEAAHRATLHLIETGSRRIAYLGGPRHLDMNIRRKHGYLEALKEEGLKIDPSMVFDGEVSYGKAFFRSIWLLNSDNPPDALLCFNAIVTNAAFMAAKSLGLRIPEDIAIAGFTETESTELMTPSITAMKDQSYKMGVRTCEALLRHINGDKTVTQEVVPMMLYTRDSSMKTNPEDPDRQLDLRGVFTDIEVLEPDGEWWRAPIGLEDEIKILLTAKTDSTNRYLRDYKGEEGIHYTVMSAFYQTAGRGQGTNTWESEWAKNLLFSIKAHPVNLAASRQFLLLEALSLALYDVLLGVVPGMDTPWLDSHKHIKTAATSPYPELNGAEISIKWPNDIYMGNRKISGTLTECDITGKTVQTCILGTGLNVNQELFVSDAPNPVSLFNITGKEVDMRVIFDTILRRFSFMLALINFEHYDEVHRRYTAALYRRTGWHNYEDAAGRFPAEFVEVKNSGHLVLRRTDGTLSEYEFKEVRYII